MIITHLDLRQALFQFTPNGDTIQLGILHGRIEETSWRLTKCRVVRTFNLEQHKTLRNLGMNREFINRN
jgi:hypothetical protein